MVDGLRVVKKLKALLKNGGRVFGQPWTDLYTPWIDSEIEVIFRNIRTDSPKRKVHVYE
jgi:hypothetical protein